MNPDKVIQQLEERVSWYQQSQAQLRKEGCGDEAIHMQVAANVYHTFLSICQSTKNDLPAAIEKFSRLVDIWESRRRLAKDNNDFENQFTETLKIDTAKEILAGVKEAMSHA